MDMDNGGEVAYWLTQHPEEAKKLADLTGLNKVLPLAQFRKAVLKAANEFAKIDLTPSTPAAETPPKVTAPAVPALPVNPKPNTTKAPRPPSPVNDRGGVTVKSTKDATTVEEYEAAWLAKQAAKTTRR